MGFLQRLLHKPPASDATSAPDEPPVEPADDADERGYELELLKGEQERLSELAQRQLRYAKYAWRPPAQGGDRRADDEDPPG